MSDDFPRQILRSDSEERVRMVRGALKFERSGGMDDWWLIVRAEHEGVSEWVPTTYGAAWFDSARVSDACVEGSLFEMLGLADAIEKRASCHHRRCAVEVADGHADFWSPRNSMERARVPLDVADALAKQIREAA